MFGNEKRNARKHPETRHALLESKIPKKSRDEKIVHENMSGNETNALLES